MRHERNTEQPAGFRVGVARGRSAPFHKLMNAMWRAPADPSIHADIGVEADALVAFQRNLQAQGHRITMTAFVAKAAAYALTQAPDCNVVSRKGRMVPRDSVRVWVYATDDDGRVAGRPLMDADQMDLLTVQRLADGMSRRLHEGESHNARRTYQAADRLPGRLLRPALRWTTWWLHRFGAGGRRGLDRDGFGAVGVTNVGSLGIRDPPAVPIPPLARHIFLLTVGQVHDRPVVRDGEVIAAPFLPVTGTLDHRAMVGLSAARVLHAFQHALTDMELLRSFLPDEMRGEVFG